MFSSCWSPDVLPAHLPPPPLPKHGPGCPCPSPASLGKGRELDSWVKEARPGTWGLMREAGMPLGSLTRGGVTTVTSLLMSYLLGSLFPGFLGCPLFWDFFPLLRPYSSLMKDLFMLELCPGPSLLHSFPLLSSQRVHAHTHTLSYALRRPCTPMPQLPMLCCRQLPDQALYSRVPAAF